MIRTLSQQILPLLGAALLAVTIQACGPQATPDVAEASSAPAYSRINTPHPEDPLDTHIYELANGLQVYLTANPEEPRFYAEIAVRAGSKHDPADATGLAHYLEHLLFKGNQQLGTLDYAAEEPLLDEIARLYELHFHETDEQRRREIYAEINNISQQAAQYAIANEIDTLYNSMGASGLNAHTWHEETVYKVALPTNRLPHWAKIESDRFRDPVFRLFHTELEVVYEEKNRTLDNPARLSAYALSELLYKNHPYGQQPTIGTSEHLKNPSLLYIQDYFDTWYVPNNMAIFISGDIDIEETITLIAEHFSDWEPRPLPELGPWPEDEIKGIERTTVSYPGQEQVQIAFRTAPHNHPDKEALVLLDMILDNRTAGLINLNLNQRQRVQGAGASPEFHNDYGSQRLWGVPRQNQTLDQVEQLLLEQLELIKRGEFDDWIIPAIVNDFERMEKRSLESNTARVSNMRQAFLTNADWDYHVEGLQRLRSVSKQDVIDVANKYFDTSSYVAVHRINAPADIPEVEKPHIDPVMIDPSRQSEFARTILSLPYEEIEPRFLKAGEDYQITQYADKVPLYYAPNPLNDLFSFSISIELGTEENDYLSLAAALLDKSGTNDFSAEELQKEWYRLGSDFRVSAGANESVISISGLDQNFPQTLALMLEVLRSPVAEESVLEELKDTVLKARADQRESPQAISQALFLYNRYGDDSPMLRTLTSEQIRAARTDELLHLFGELLSYEHTLSYTGSLPLEQVLEIVGEHHLIDQHLLPTPPERLRRTRVFEGNEIYLVNRPTAQAQVRIEFADGIFDNDLVVPASLYNSYFGTSMSSVVFQELREARALAYSASARYAQGARQESETLILGAIGSQNDKAIEATLAFIDLFDNMPQSSERFEHAHQAMINRYRTATTSFRQVNSTVRSWQRLGLQEDPGPQRFTQLQESTLEDLYSFQRDRVASRPKLISIVGDLSRMELEQLEALGPVTELTVDDIFVD